MTPIKRLPLLALLLAGNALAAEGAAFVLVSPASVENIASLRDTAEGKQAIQAAAPHVQRTPNPMPVVRTEGLLPGEGQRDASLKAQEDWRQTLTQALAYRLSGDKQYLDAAEKYISAWLDIYRPSYNPIDETALTPFLTGFDLVQGNLPKDLAQRGREFGRELATGYLLRKPKHGGPSTERNNWQSHRVKLATAGAFASGDEQLIQQAREAFQKHLEVNLRPDGSTYDFTQRDAMHYVVYTLEPMLFAALAAKAHGQDWYRLQAPSGASLKKSLVWLEPYARGERKHEEFVNSTVAFDKKRAQAGVKGYAGPFDRNKASILYWFATALDADFRKTRDTLEPPPEWVRVLVDSR